MMIKKEISYSFIDVFFFLCDISRLNFKILIVCIKVIKFTYLLVIIAVFLFKTGFDIATVTNYN